MMWKKKQEFCAFFVPVYIFLFSLVMKKFQSASIAAAFFAIQMEPRC